MHGSYSGEGAKLGPYRIVKRLGIGGTSEVLLAVSQGPYGFERTVVIKRLLPKCEWDPPDRMLAAEAVAYARLTHPGDRAPLRFFRAGRARRARARVRRRAVARASRTMLRDAARSARRSGCAFTSCRASSRRWRRLMRRGSAYRRVRAGRPSRREPGERPHPVGRLREARRFRAGESDRLSGDTRGRPLKGTYGLHGARAGSRRSGDAADRRLRRMPLPPRDAPFAPRRSTQGKMAELELLRRRWPIRSSRRSRRFAAASRPAWPMRFAAGSCVDPEERTLTAAEMVRVLRQRGRSRQRARRRSSRSSRAFAPPSRARRRRRIGRCMASSPLSTTLRFNRFGIPSSATRRRGPRDAVRWVLRHAEHDDGVVAPAHGSTPDTWPPFRPWFRGGRTAQVRRRRRGGNRHRRDRGGGRCGAARRRGPGEEGRQAETRRLPRPSCDGYADHERSARCRTPRRRQ